MTVGLRFGFGSLFNRAVRLLVLAAAPLTAAAPAAAQEMADDMVGQNEKAWQAWHGAMNALEKDKSDEAIKLLDDIAKMDLSPLRLALMADRTGSLRFEQAVAADKAGENGKKLLDAITTGRKQRQYAEDGWHFAAIGRFELANANFKALVEAGPDPVALLELSRYNENRHLILVKVMSNSEVGAAAKAFLDLLSTGEEELRKDPFEITANIAKLTGSPRVVYNATNALKTSGEYAIPHLIRFLQDSSKEELKSAIIKALPQIGRGALNPLCVALSMKDQVTRQILIEALGEIGYRQALPYLARIAESSDKSMSGEIRDAARAAMRKIDGSATDSPAALFLDLAEAYHADLDSVRADARAAMANIWYFEKEKLTYVPVPREVFNDIMAMRCCEAVLDLGGDGAKATALWIASNFRREAKLGMDVESESSDPKAAKDATRPAGYPRSIYFARSAGPLYDHLVVARAVKDRDPGVALGAVAALAATAGEGNMLGIEDAKQPLVEALAFPNRLVRIRVALAIGRTLPTSEFKGAYQVVPVLNEALTLSARKTAMVVDPKDATRNRAQAVLRAAGMDVVAGSHLNEALSMGRTQKMTGYDLVLLASDIANPNLDTAVATLRGDFVTAATPIIIISRAGQTAAAVRAKRSAQGVETLVAEQVEGGTPEEAAGVLTDRYRLAASTFGVADLTEELAAALTSEACDVIRMLAMSHSKAIDYQRSEPGLITVLTGKAEPLRVSAARALARLDSATSQTALAESACNDKNTASLRVAVFGALADSARVNGNKLDNRLVSRVIDITMNEKDLGIRTAASQALGALNLPANRASEIIKAQARG